MSPESASDITPEEEIENGEVPSPSASAPLLKRDQATAVSADSVTVPIASPLEAVSDRANDWPDAIASVRSLTVTVMVRSVFAESAESVALTWTTYSLSESESAGLS